MNNEDLLREGECPLSNCIEPEGHTGPHSFQLSKAAPICALCGEETDDDFFCYGCRNYVCEVCDTYGRAPFGYHNLDDHVEHEENE